MKQWQTQPLLLTCALNLALFSLSSRTLAQTSFRADKFPPSQEILEFEPPPDGAPGDRQNSGSRPGCPRVQKPFMALVPATNLGITVAEYPTFWLHVPYPSGCMELVLEDEITKRTVYKSQFQITKASGIISFRLPQTSPGLEINKKYRWRFFFFGNPASHADFMAVNGVVKRRLIDKTLQRQLKRLSPLQRVKLYAKHGIWHEALTELAKLRLLYPQANEIIAAWTDLLQHPLVRLDELILEPFVSCTSARSRA